MYGRELFSLSEYAFKGTECGVFVHLSVLSLSISQWFTATEICETRCSPFLRVLHDDFKA